MATPRLDILYQDERLVAVAKPSGLVVHPSVLATDRVNCMTLLRDQLGRWVHPVHRLDRGASGVLLFALDRETARALADAFAAGRMEKAYLAVVRGVLPDEGEIDHPVPSGSTGRPVSARTSFRRLAQVELREPVGRYPTARYSLAEAVPTTGRFHQIRRHLAHIHHPLVGDVTHGDGRHNRFFRERFGVRRLLLHAHRLVLAHPRDGRPLRLEARPPAEMATLLDALGWTEALDAVPALAAAAAD